MLPRLLLPHVGVSPGQVRRARERSHAFLAELVSNILILYSFSSPFLMPFPQAYSKVCETETENQGFLVETSVNESYITTMKITIVITF